MRVIDLHLSPHPDAVPHARHALDDLTGLASQTSLDDARLLVSELVTNSVRHGQLSMGEDISLRADVEGETLHVEVRDSGGGFELQPGLADADDRDSGWGLFLVGRLADRWGVSADGSSMVWFDIPLRRAAEDLLA
jgi:anti-sigma regulatory factor (Ser/Thr protein kinase)